MLGPSMILGGVTHHEDSKERTDRQERIEGATEGRTDLQDGDADQIANERPFATVPIREDAEGKSADGAEEQSQSNGGSDLVCVVCIDGSEELIRQSVDGQRHAEEVFAIKDERRGQSKWDPSAGLLTQSGKLSVNNRQPAGLVCR